MKEISKKQFLEAYSKAIVNGNSALLIGMGMSIQSSIVDCRALQREIAVDFDYNLDVDEETNSIIFANDFLITQCSRFQLNNAIIENLNRRSTTSKIHRLIALLPTETVWTTNCDRLIETAYGNVEKSVDVKYSPGQVTSRQRKTDVTVYKMNGDISDPDQAVLLKDEYDFYHVHRKPFTEMLRADFTRNCFLFVGFSFTDPNIQCILSRLKRVLKGSSQKHYCIMCRPYKPIGYMANLPEEQLRYKRDLERFDKLVLDLKRYGIQTVPIDSIKELEEMMLTLVRLAAMKNVFFSGRVLNYQLLGEQTLKSLAQRIGKELVQRGYNLVSGYGLGIDGACILGAHEVLSHDNGAKGGQRLFLRTIPKNPPLEPEGELQNRIRKEMIEQSAATIFLGGTGFTPTDGTIMMDEIMMREFEYAKERNHVIIPLAFSGSAARQIWREVKSDMPKFFGSVDVTVELTVLYDISKGEDAWIEAIFSILEKMRR